MIHVCASEEGRLFCTCGKVIDPESLKSIKFAGFTGTASTNPNMEKFWQTGDPAVFDGA